MKRSALFLLLSTLTLVGCEEEFNPPVSDAPRRLVVEGYIEGGEQPSIPYVVLTRSIPFFSRIDGEAFEKLFVHDAVITVDDGDKVVQLTEFCLGDLPPELREQAAAFLGVSNSNLGFNFCVYIDDSFVMRGREGYTYDLRVEAEGEVLTARTTIPVHVPLDTLFFVDPPGEPVDTLAQLRVILADPAGQANYYRYFTRVNSGPLLIPDGSVTDDLLFDGQRFEFPLSRAGNPGEQFDLATFGLYERGDTAMIKWMNLPEDHFDFWNTLEFSVANQGPFSSYTRVDHNIEGGLGIWGGLSASYHSRIVPEE